MPVRHRTKRPVTGLASVWQRMMTFLEEDDVTLGRATQNFGCVPRCIYLHSTRELRDDGKAAHRLTAGPAVPARVSERRLDRPNTP